MCSIWKKNILSKFSHFFPWGICRVSLKSVGFWFRKVIFLFIFRTMTVIPSLIVFIRKCLFLMRKSIIFSIWNSSSYRQQPVIVWRIILDFTIAYEVLFFFVLSCISLTIALQLSYLFNQPQVIFSDPQINLWNRTNSLWATTFILRYYPLFFVYL